LGSPRSRCRKDEKADPSQKLDLSHGPFNLGEFAHAIMARAQGRVKNPNPCCRAACRLSTKRRPLGGLLKNSNDVILSKAKNLLLFVFNEEHQMLRSARHVPFFTAYSVLQFRGPIRAPEGRGFNPAGSPRSSGTAFRP
jgi:hypothetical protein